MLFGTITLLLLAGAGILVLRSLRGERTAPQRLAAASVPMGLSAVVLTGIIAVLSFTLLLDDLASRNAFAALGFLGLPVSLLAIGAGVIGLRAEPRRAAVGLALSTISLATWVVMATAAG